MEATEQKKNRGLQVKKKGKDGETERERKREIVRARRVYN